MDVRRESKKIDLCFRLINLKTFNFSGKTGVSVSQLWNNYLFLTDFDNRNSVEFCVCSAHG